MMKDVKGLLLKELKWKMLKDVKWKMLKERFLKDFKCWMAC